MFDAAFLEQCADPGVKIEIVEHFIAAVGTDNPLAISITSGNRVILPEPPKTPEEAVVLARRFVGQAVVRAGVTGFPVGVGISDVSEISADLFDACKNIGMGTALFGKVYRIVAHARGAESGTVLTDALAAWRTGQFGHAYVFAEPDPDRLPEDAHSIDPVTPGTIIPSRELEPIPSADLTDPRTAGIRVELPAQLPRE